ncbi:putative histone-arginine methyltransferase 1.3 [Senna tora]|uniref:Putative histone-arginine methyltransferase 1.3 n=1 Tax=Senna tora TaxID=362788 RepID=A0A834SD93_9FABA|nr:putative histone-arginine methyltransferase 1.3 [Senna tora]
MPTLRSTSAVTSPTPLQSPLPDRRTSRPRRRGARFQARRRSRSEDDSTELYDSAGKCSLGLLSNWTTVGYLSSRAIFFFWKRKKLLRNNHSSILLYASVFGGHALCSWKGFASVRLDKLLAVTIDDIGKETFIMGGALDPFKRICSGISTIVLAEPYALYAIAGAKHIYAVEASVMAEYAQKLIVGNPTLGNELQ